MRLNARVLVLFFAAFCGIVSTAPSIADNTATPAPAPTPVDQTQYYGVTARSYAQIPFPDFNFFIFSRKIGGFPAPPTFMPMCSASGISAPGSLQKGLTNQTVTDVEVANDVRVAYRDLDDLLYRLRACDYYMSVYAWNTRQSQHDEIFDYSWHTGCNSFATETDPSVMKLSEAAFGVYASNAPTDQRKQALTRFLLDYYEQYADLYERVDSCSNIVSSLTYGANKRRFFCSYGGFIGALLTASAVAFGKHWGGSSSSTQSQVQGLGTVMLALPGLCQNSSPGSAKGTKGASG